MAYLFGYWRPGVRISTLRPKEQGMPLGIPCSFLLAEGVFNSNPFVRMHEGVRMLRSEIGKLVCQAESESIFALSEYLHTRQPPRLSFSFLSVWVMRTSLCEAEWSSFFKRSRRRACSPAASAEILPKGSTSTIDSPPAVVLFFFVGVGDENFTLRSRMEYCRSGFCFF